MEHDPQNSLSLPQATNLSPHRDTPWGPRQHARYERDPLRPLAFGGSY